MLGLPGLLELDQVSALLHERQAKQSRAPGRRPRAEQAPVSAHRALAAQRKELNALVAAETMTGRDGNTAHALPHDRLRAIMQRYGRLGDTAHDAD